MLQKNRICLFDLSNRYVQQTGTMMNKLQYNMSHVNFIRGIHNKLQYNMSHVNFKGYTPKQWFVSVNPHDL